MKCLWEPRDELNERLVAIEAVSHAHHNVEVVEHLLVGLVEFLSSGRLSRAESGRSSWPSSALSQRVSGRSRRLSSLFGRSAGRS